jgi:hypothetical protein
MTGSSSSLRCARLPILTANNVPLCSESACPSYDGKRCIETGFQPNNICEPAVADMAAALRKPCPACGAEFV